MRNRLIKILAAVLLCCSIVCFVIACAKGSDYTFPEYSYTNPDNSENPDLDEGITLDGDLGEDFWNGKWFSSSLQNQDDIWLEMTSRIGEKGVYFAFRVQDNPVYATEEREAFNNSGVELYISTADGADTLNNATGAFEIDVNANGMTRISKWTARTSGYSSWPAKFYSAVKTQGGEVNTDECTGYTIEMYLPYLMLGLDEKPEFVYANPTLIRSLAPDKQAGRLWYNFGMQNRNADWSIAKSWYQFSDDGLVAQDVVKEVTGNGSIICSDTVVSGDSLSIEVRPDNGYIATALRINGSDYLNELSYQNGKTVCTLEQVDDTVVIEAEFSPLGQNKTVTGTLTSDPLPPNSNYAVFTLYAARGGYYKELTISSDGTFTAELPSNDMYIYAAADGYMTVRAEVKADETQVALAASRSFLGNNANVNFESFDQSKWDMTLLGEGTARSSSTDIPNSAVHTEIFSDRIFVSGNILLPKGARDRRAGFAFYTPSGSFAYFAVTWSIEQNQNRYDGNTITNTDRWENAGFTVTGIDGCEELLASPDGMPFAILYHDGLFDIWVNGVKVQENMEFKTNNSNMFKDGDTVLKAGVGIQTWAYGATFKNLVFLSGDEAVGLTSPYSVVKNVSAGGSVEVSKETYNAGDDITVTLKPDAGFAVSAVTVNGIDYFLRTVDNTFTVEGWDRSVFVLKVEFTAIKDEVYTLGGNVTQYKDGETTPAEGAVLTLKDTGSFEQSATAGADGSYSFAEIPSGTYILTVVKDGFIEQSRTISVRGDASFDFMLEWNFATDAFGGADLSAMNDADHKITIDNWGSATITADVSDTFYVAFTLKGSEWVGYWSDNFGIRITENRGFSFLFESPNGGKFIKLQWGYSAGDTEQVETSDAVKNAIWGDGLNVMVIRDENVAYLYAEIDGSWQYLHRLTIDPENYESEIAIEQWGKSVYTNISVHDGGYPLEIVKNDVQNGSYTVNEAKWGEDVVITFEPASGYALSGLTVNGQSSAELGGEFSTDGTTYTLKNWHGDLSLEISVTFAPRQESDISFDLLLHSYRFNGGTAAAAPDGTAVRLMGMSQYDTTVQDGKVTIEGVIDGDYSLTVEGYRPITISVGGTLESSYTLEYDAIGENAAYDTSKINDGDLSIIANGWPGDVYLTDKIPANTDFLISANVKSLDVVTDLRYGFNARADLNNDGQYSNSGDASTEMIMANVVQQGDGDLLQFCNFWIGAYISGNAQTAFTSENGLRIAFGRIDGVFYMFMHDGSAMVQAISLNSDNGLSTAELELGFQGWDNSLGVVFNDMTLEIGEITSISVFAGGVEGVHHISDQDNNTKVTLSSDLSKYNEDSNWEISWNTVTNEAVWLGEESDKNFVYETTAKVAAIDNFRMSPFLFRYGNGNGNSGVDIIAMDIMKDAGAQNSVKFQIYERWWDSPSDQVDVNLTEEQLAAIAGDGLKIRVVRQGEGFYFYADTCTGDGIPVWQLLGDRKVTVKAGITSGFVGVGIMYTTGSVSGISYSETDADKVTVISNADDLVGATMSVSDTVLGGNLVITITPEEGYIVSSVTVNGTAYTEFTDGENGAKILTISSFMMSEANIVANIIDENSDSISFDLLLHSYRLNGGTAVAAADGTAVRLSGSVQYDTTVQGGKITLDDIIYGTYTLTVEGYRPLVIEIGNDMQASYTLEYDAIGENAAYDTSKINDGDLSIIAGSWAGDIYLTDKIPANTDFLISASVKKIAGNTNLRYGFNARADLNNDGEYWNSADASTEMIMANVVQQGDGDLLQFCNYWIGAFISGNAQTAFTGENGLRIAFGRIDGVFYMFMHDGNGMAQAITLNSNNDLSTAELELGFQGWDNSQGVVFNDMTLEIGEITSINLFTGDVEGIHHITDQDNYAKITVSADLSKFNEDGNWEISWNNAAREAIWFGTPSANNFVYDVTVKTEVNSNFRTSPFLFRYGDNYGDIIAMDITNSAPAKFQIYERWWDSGAQDGADIELTAHQLAAIAGDGLKIRVVRQGDGFYFYADTCTDAESTVWQLLSERKITVMAGIGSGLVGAGIMDTTGSVSGVSYSETDADKVVVTSNADVITGGTMSVSDVVLGGDLVITVTPEEGYILNKVTVNGIAYNEFTDGENGAKILTISSFMMPKADVVAYVIDENSEDITFDLLLHSYRLNGGTAVAAADGTAVRLSGPVQYDTTVQGGKVAIEGVVYGTYTLTVEGYKPFTIELGRDMQASYTLEYDAIGENAAYDTSKINDGDLSIIANGWPGDVYLTDKIPANTDFLISANVKKLDFDVSGGASLRYGFNARADLNNDGEYWNSGDASTEMIMANVVQQGDGDLLQFCNYWIGAFISDNAQTAFTGENGLRIAFGRIDGVFYMFMHDGTSMAQAISLNSDNGLSTAELELGFQGWDNSLGVVFNDMTLEIGEITSINSASFAAA